MARKFIIQNVNVCSRVTIAERLDMFFQRITNGLLFLHLLHLTHADATDNFRAVEGATVQLPCPVNPPQDSEQVSVEWTKNKTYICKWKIDKNNNSSNGNCSQRFKIVKVNFITLINFIEIENVQPSDSGSYSCKMSKLIPPPSLDTTSSLKLQVAGLSLQQLNSSNNGSCVHLRCSLEGNHYEQANFSWSQQDQVKQHANRSNVIKSELSLCKPNWSDGDTITCHVNYSNTCSRKSIQLNSKQASQGGEHIKLLIIGSSAFAGLIFLIVLPIVICKCRKQDENETIVFTNKVYENFSFAMSRQHTQSSVKPQSEECIYEN